MVSQTKLSNGTTILIDQDTRFASASLAVCILGGSREESFAQNGITHLLEHILFKRTKRRQVRELAEAIDSLGGEVNAFTDTDSFCLHGNVSGESVVELISLFAELLFELEIDLQELELEKEVIRQEILEAHDDPHDVVYQNFTELFWPDSSLAWPVFGTLENLDRFDPRSLNELLKNSLVGEKIVIAASGNVDTDLLIAEIDKMFGHLPRGSRSLLQTPNCGAGVKLTERPVGQVYFILGLPWPSLSHSDYLEGVAVSSIFGGSVSSRLFQSAREQRGLVYGINSDIDGHRDTAALRISTNVEPKNFSSLLQLLNEEIITLRAQGVTESEVVKVKKMLNTHLDMERDSVSSLLWRLIENEIIFGRQIDSREIKAKLNQITVATINELISRWVVSEGWSAALAGSVNEIVLSDDLHAICRPKS